MLALLACRQARQGASAAVAGRASGQGAEVGLVGGGTAALSGESFRDGFTTGAAGTRPAESSQLRRQDTQQRRVGRLSRGKHAAGCRGWFSRTAIPWRLRSPRCWRMNARFVRDRVASRINSPSSSGEGEQLRPPGRRQEFAARHRQPSAGQAITVDCERSLRVESEPRFSAATRFSITSLEILFANR